MRKDTKMDAHVTKNGYNYYTPHQSGQKAQIPNETKWKKGLKWLGQAILTGLKNLPGLIMKAGVLMVTTPLMIVLFIFNLIKMLIATAIGWFVFKVVAFFALGFGIAGYSFLVQKDISVPWFTNLMDTFVFPHGVPIYYWWETTIIVVLAIITALSLTFYSDEA